MKRAQATASHVTEELERSIDLVNFFAHAACTPRHHNSGRETELFRIMAVARPLGEGEIPQPITCTTADWMFTYVVVAIEFTMASGQRY